MKTRLKFAPHASACAVHYDSPRSVSLVSYNTRVLDLLFDTDTPEPVLKVRGTWSVTTQRHMRAFICEYIDADPDAVMQGIRAVTRLPRLSARGCPHRIRPDHADPLLIHPVTRPLHPVKLWFDGVKSCLDVFS